MMPTILIIAVTSGLAIRMVLWMLWILRKDL